MISEKRLWFFAIAFVTVGLTMDGAVFQQK
jgi:hypothetical protein